MFHRLLVANRGEVAVRIARSCDRLGIVPVFAVSTADMKSPYLRDRTFVVIGDGPPSESYLCAERLVAAAKQTRCTAIHPGWGFLAESASFSALCVAHGITFVGPSPAAMIQLGNKVRARAAMAKAGLQVLPSSERVVKDVADALRLIREHAIPYPLMVKARSGGGGRGMRVVEEEDQLSNALQLASKEAAGSFGDGGLYLEHYLRNCRHVEVQIVADRWGKVVAFDERDCSLQRNHQKIIEESPCPILEEEQRSALLLATREAVASVGYEGVGTAEFLLDEDGAFHFIEMNTRLQVEHGITEMLFDVDLVEQSIRIALGEHLHSPLPARHGHAIECRINAENAWDGFHPNVGVVSKWKVPSQDMKHLRVDSHVEEGYEVPPFYDSLLAKVMTRGTDRPDAIARMAKALGELTCEGIHTTREYMFAMVTSDAFVAGDFSTDRLPDVRRPSSLEKSPKLAGLRRSLES